MIQLATLEPLKSHPEYAVQYAPVILTRPPRPGPLRRQVRLQSPPLRLRQVTSSHPTQMGSQL